MFSFFRALDRNVPNALLVSVPAGFPYFPKEGKPAVSGRFTPAPDVAQYLGKVPSAMGRR